MRARRASQRALCRGPSGDQGEEGKGVKMCGEKEGPFMQRRELVCPICLARVTQQGVRTCVWTPIGRSEGRSRKWEEDDEEE